MQRLGRAFDIEETRIEPRSAAPYADVRRIDHASKPIAPNHNKFRRFHGALIKLAVRVVWNPRSPRCAPLNRNQRPYWVCTGAARAGHTLSWTHTGQSAQTPPRLASEPISCA
jgi:hypothetical protein